MKLFHTTTARQQFNAKSRYYLLGTINFFVDQQKGNRLIRGDFVMRHGLERGSYTVRWTLNLVNVEASY